MSDKPQDVTAVTFKPPQKRKMPRDPNQRAKLNVDMILGEAPD